MMFHGLLICIASIPHDPCVYHEPEEGRGHVSYSREIPFVHLAREALTECEIVHGDGAFDVVCRVSREVTNDPTL